MNLDKPWESFLPEELEPELQIDLINHSNLLKNLVSLGSHCLKWEVGRVAKTEEESLEIIAITSILREILGLLDSCANNLEKGNLSPCGILSRPILELVAEFDFLLADKNEIEHRVRCFIMMTYGDELQMLIDYRGQPGYLKIETEVESRISELEIKLRLPYFASIMPEYQAVRKAKQDKWYTLATWNKTKVGNKGQTVSGKIIKIKGLITDLKERGRNTDYMAFSLLSNFIHPSLLVQRAVGSDSQGKLHLNPVAFPDGYSEFTRGIINTVSPIFTALNYRFTPHQRFQYQIAAGELNNRYRVLFLHLFKLKWAEEAKLKNHQY